MQRLFYLLMLVMMGIALEAFCLVVYASRLVLAEPIYRYEYFSCNGCKTIKSDEVSDLPLSTPLGWGYYDPEIGWDSYRNGKRVGPSELSPCGSAFGDSFTHADEVKDSEAWPFRLSELLGCEIENYGAGGYGQDQAYLKYLKYHPNGDLVIVAMTQEMLRRNLAASWRFYAGLPNTVPKPIFHIKAGQLVLERAPQQLDAAQIAAHHRFDRYAAPFRIGFPYSLSLLKVLYYRMVPSAYAANRIEPFNTVWNTPAAVNLSIKLFAAHVGDAKRDNKKFVLLLVPSTGDVASNQRVYTAYRERVAEAVPGVCIIDLLTPLRAQYELSGPLNAPEQHFNAVGNQAIATAVLNGIKDCGLVGS